MAVRLGGSTLLQAWKSRESQCRWCKKVFAHTDEHVYKGCCSWSCLCRIREHEADRKKSRRTKLIIRTEAQALARVADCQAKIAFYESMRADAVVNPKTKKSARQSLWEWRCKLNDAERTLRIIRGEQDADEQYA